MDATTDIGEVRGKAGPMDWAVMAYLRVFDREKYERVSNSRTAEKNFRSILTIYNSETPAPTGTIGLDTDFKAWPFEHIGGAGDEASHLQQLNQSGDYYLSNYYDVGPQPYLDIHTFDRSGNYKGSNHLRYVQHDPDNVEWVDDGYEQPEFGLEGAKRAAVATQHLVNWLEKKK